MHLPTEEIGSEEYVRQLEGRIDECDFPDPDPDLIPSLTEARYLAYAANDDGHEEFAVQLMELHESVLQPLRRYDAVMQVVCAMEEGTLDPEQLEGLDRQDLFAEIDLFEADPREVRDVLDEREKTFLDYPAPPHHVIEGALHEGRDALEAEGRDEAVEVDGDGEFDEPYADDRYQVEAVVRGAKDLAREAYEDDRFREELADENRSGFEYEDADHFADAIAFNAALAAESMLESEGEIVTPP